MSVKCLTQEQCTKHEALVPPLELKMLASLGEGQTTSMMFLNLCPLRVTSISFLLTTLPLNETLLSRE